MNTTTWKNRALSVVLTVIMVFSMLPMSVFAADSTPGTAGDPLLITSAEELADFCERVNKGENTLHARLTADIDLKDRVWTPIEVETEEGEDPTGYSGTFDGNGYEIRGLRFNKANAHGLFAMIASDGLVRDLFLVIDKENEIGTSCGFIAAVNEGTVERCSVEVTATQTVASKDGFGLIVAYNRDGGLIEDCYAGSAKITGNTSSTWIKLASTVSDIKSAGIAYDNVGTIKSCFFRGFLGEGDYAITAKNYGEVTNSYCFNPKAYDSNDNKYKYLYADEGSGYGYGDIGIHYSSSYSGNKNLTTQNGSLTWQLNNGDETGSTINNGPWRLHEATNWGSDYHDYPTLRKTDARVFKEADGTFRIEPPHFHEIDGKQVELTQVRYDSELRSINEGYVCLGDDITLLQKWQPTGEVILCLNGHSLNITASGIELKNGAELTLLNCNEKNTGHIGGSDRYSADYGVAVKEGGTLHMESGCISRCNTGVIVDGGTFYMTGGEIKDCTNRAGIEYSSGNLTLGGHAKVANNTQSQNILLIQNGKTIPTITFDDPQDDALFGICVAKRGNRLEAVTNGRVAVTGENCQQYYKHLFADKFICDTPQADYDLYLGENGTIEIGVRGKHTHCLCGAEHKVSGCKDVDGKAVGHLTDTQIIFATPWNPYEHIVNKQPTLPTEAGSYYLTCSMTIESNGSYQWTPTGDVNLCLNGHTITYRITSKPSTNDDYSGWIRVLEGNTLTVTDCSNQGTVACERSKSNGMKSSR